MSPAVLDKSIRSDTDPTLGTLVEAVIEQALKRTNAHAFGQIQTFDRTQQSCTATMGYKKTLPDGTLDDYPVLVDCPCLFLGGGGSGKGRLTFDLAKGDDCLILFTDRALDTWIVQGQVSKLPSPRKHAFQDAVVIAGLRPFTRSLGSFLANGAELAWGTTTLQLTSTVKLANASSDLRTELNALVDLISTIVGQLTPSTGMTSANIAANQAALTAFKTTLAGLLT